MQFKEKNYFFLVLLHVFIGLTISFFPVTAKIYGVLILVVSAYFIVKTKNQNHEILGACAYIVGSEVFLRMTQGSLSYEFAKYSLIFFALIGMMYSGFSKNAVPYWVFLILLIPGILIGIEDLNTNSNIRTTISFNISGPISLGFITLYTYQKKIKLSEINNILLLLGLPIISCVVYLYLYSSSSERTLVSTGSNFDLSGGFGPNQVATILGLGMFIFFSRLLLVSRTKLMFAVNFVLAFYVGYRGVLTFSRGGMITGAGMIAVLLYYIYMNSKKKIKLKLLFIIVFFVISISSILMYSSYKTDGLIGNRYANKDALGREKTDKLTGRLAIAEQELNLFFDNPVFGVGVARGSEIRKMQTSEIMDSHDEITRLLAEHGSLGIIALMVLFFTPIVLFLNNREHIYMSAFLVFWFLTINHAAMRTAAPSFIYALALLKVKFDE